MELFGIKRSYFVSYLAVKGAATSYGNINMRCSGKIKNMEQIRNAEKLISSQEKYDHVIIMNYKLLR